jgi:hypothetical protein
MWVVDHALCGIQMKCRQSQLKFVAPMQSLTKKAWLKLGLVLDESLVDDAYDTVDVNSWDDKLEKGRLSIRAIQLLEASGACYEILKGCAEDGTEDLERFATDKSFFSKMALKRHSQILARGERDLVYSMEVAGVHHTEPVFSQKIAGMVTAEVEGMRSKVRINTGVNFFLLQPLFAHNGTNGLHTGPVSLERLLELENDSGSHWITR